MGFKEFGILPEALINYMALLGWSKEDNKEIYFMNDLIKSFNVDSIGKSGAKFDFEKLIWINSQHIQKMPSENLAKKLSSTGKNGLEVSAELVDLIKNRLDRLGNIKEEYGYLFEQQKIEPALKNKLINDESLSFLQKYINATSLH